jgi:hypothetical protein
MYKLWIVLICITGAIALWFLSHALYDLNHYWKLGPTIPVEITQWKIQEISSSRFGIEALYSYEVNGKRYEGKTFFNKPIYLNPYAAEADLKKWQAHSWQAWYQKSHPEISSLQRNFPAKTMIHALLTLGVFVYFYLVREMSSKKDLLRN